MTPSICDTCRARLAKQIQFLHRRSKLRPQTRAYSRPSFAPKPTLDLKHIRENPGLYEQNSIDRNYPAYARNSWEILGLHEALVRSRNEVKDRRQRNNALEKEIQRHARLGDNEQDSRQGNVNALVEEARKIKDDLRGIDVWEKEVKEKMDRLALDIPNLSSNSTPVGQKPQLVGWIGGEQPVRRSGVSHLEIGKELNILDFEASAVTSGWGWYFLKNEGALLEQALIQYALSVAMASGWKVMTPPSLVYSHIANACGFMPRDQNGETQVYNIAQSSHDTGSESPNLVLAGTAEIPFAASQADATIHSKDLPLKVIGPSRCYRAEAGARGVDTKGLYRVHEFTKVEMFAWTIPPARGEGRFETGLDSDELECQTNKVFAEMLDIQKTILSSLGLHAKILEMPSEDLGASATRKVDIEAYFPSRTGINDGYGELTSASICTDYQTRRLGTRLKGASGKLTWPYTLNGTAVAIPRVLACLLENGWDESTRRVRVPEVLRRWMPGNIEFIE